MNYRSLVKSQLKNAMLDLRGIFPPKAELARNQQLRGAYAGKRLFILGSGGSIKNYDLTKLSAEFVMTQNNFFVHEQNLQIDPNFHCVVPFYQTEKEVPTWVEWIGEMVERCPNATFFFGCNTRPMLEQYFAELREKVFYVDARYDVLSLRRARADLTKSVMAMQTVTTQCLIVALYLGFSEIYLLGFDNDQILAARGMQNRFYGVSRITDTQAERDIVKAQYGQNITRSWFNKWLTSKQCDLLEIYSHAQGSRIFNASTEGVLDNFERRPLRDVLGCDVRLNGGS